MPPTDWVVKDSGQRQEYDSGMVRDLQDGKARFDLLMPLGVPYSEQFLTRWAVHMAKGAEKYGDRNFEKADSEEEVARFRSSAFRHFMQWLSGLRDEDHAAAVAYNIMAAEMTMQKIADKEGS